MYPMHLPTASYSRVISRLLRATWSARGVRSLPGRAGVGSFVREGTAPPRYVMTTSRRVPRRFQLSFSHRERWTVNSWRIVYSPLSKVSASVALGCLNNPFTLTRFPSFLSLSPRFFNFWRCFCDSFLCRITKVSRAQITGLSWTQ